jgi:hypothetical protein
MRKSASGQGSVGGLAAIAAGLVAIVVGTILMLAYGGTHGGPSGDDFVLTLNAFFWWMVGLISAGVLLGAAGVIVQIVAWVGALINMFALLDKTWFVVLLTGGLLGLVGVLSAPFAVMIIYLIAGPDLEECSTGGTAPVRQPTTLAPAS